MGQHAKIVNVILGSALNSKHLIFVVGLTSFSTKPPQRIIVVKATDKVGMCT